MSASFLKLNPVWLEQLHEVHAEVQIIGFQALIIYAYATSVAMGFDEEDTIEFDDNVRYQMAVYMLWSENPHSKKVKIKKINKLKQELKNTADKSEALYDVYQNTLFDIDDLDVIGSQVPNC